MKNDILQKLVDGQIQLWKRYWKHEISMHELVLHLNNIRQTYRTLGLK